MSNGCSSGHQDSGYMSIMLNELAVPFLISPFSVWCFDIPFQNEIVEVQSNLKVPTKIAGATRAFWGGAAGSQIAGNF